MISALRNAAFRRIVYLYSINLLVDWFGAIALTVLVYTATGSATLSAASLVCKQVIPGALVPLLGAALDRSGVRVVIALGFAAQGASLVAVAESGYGLAVFPLSIVIGVAGAAVRSALRTSVAWTLVGPELRGGNAVLNLVMGAAAPVGPIAAAAVVAFAGPGVTALAAGLVLVALVPSALLAPSVGVRDAVADPEPELADSAPVAPIAAPQVPVSWLLALVGVVCTAYAMDQPALLPYATDALGAGVRGYGAIFTAWGVGVALGSVLFARLLGRPMLKIYVFATALSGLSYLGMAVSPAIGITCLIAVLGGIGNGMDWAAIVTAIQESTPASRQGAVSARLEGIVTAAPGVGILVGGVLADLTGPRFPLAAAGAVSLGALCLGTAAMRLRSGAVRRPASKLSPTIQGGRA